MTKINKLGKSTFVIAILSFLLVAVLAFGGTYAYFTSATEKAEGTFKTGKVQISSEAATIVIDKEGVVPGAPIVDEAITLAADVNVKTIIIAVMKLTTAGDIEAEHITFETSKTDAWGEVTLDAAEADSRAFVLGSGTTWYISAADDSISFTDGKIYLDNQVTSGTTTTYANQNVDITMEITFYAVQYDYLTEDNGDAFSGNSAAACYKAAKDLAIDALPAYAA